MLDKEVVRDFLRHEIGTGIQIGIGLRAK